MSAMTRVGNVFTLFDDNGVKIQDKHSCKVLGYGNLVGDVYLLQCSVVATLNVIQNKSSLELWHRRLGHCGADRLKTSIQKQLVTGLEGTKGDLMDCEACRRPVLRREQYHQTIYWSWCTRMCVGRSQLNL